MTRFREVPTNTKYSIIELDERPVLLAQFDGKWSVDHSICYVERESPLPGDIYEMISRVRTHSLEPILAYLEELAVTYDL